MRKLKLFFACLLMAVLSIGQVWADEVTFNYADYKTKGGPNGTGSDYTMADKADVSIGDTKFWGNNSQAHFYAGGVTTITPAANVTITQIVLTATESKYNGYQSSGTMTWSTGMSSANDKVVTWTGSAASAFTLTHNKQIRWTSIVVTYSKGSTPPPSKTLESVTVSGTPTKTSYTAGEDFDPAGLTVTGHYSEGPDEEITSGITWSYNPSQTLALNQTSIGVTATVGEVSSEEFNISLSVIEAPTTVTFAYEDYKTKGGPSGAGSDYTMVKSQVSIGDTKFYGNNSYAHFYASGVTTITPAAGVTITKMVLTASAENYNGYQSSGTVTASVGSVSHEGVIVTWTGSTDEAFTISHDKQIRWMTIVVTYEQGEAPAVAKPTISGETPFLGSTTVTISHDDADYIYYTTNGDAPTTSSVEYTEPFSLTETATVKAIAVKGSAESAAAEKAFTKATVLTVAEALAATPAANQYVKGIIASITEVQLEQYFNATYTIKDEGVENSMIVYRGKYLNNADFTSLDQIMEGDEVTVYGNLVDYKGTNQLGQNNYIIVQKKIARIAWSAASYEADIDNLSGNVYPTLINNDNLAVSYSSTDISVAEIDANGVITLNATGTTTIKATYTATDAFRGNEVSYELNVVSNAIKVTISFDVDGGDAIEALTEQNALPNPLPVATKAGKNFGGWFTDAEKTVPAVAGAAITENTTLHAKWLEPYSVAEAKTVIDANPSGIANQYVAGIISQIDSYNSKYNSITYWISADGTKDNQLQVYSGLIGNAATALEKESFTQKEDLELGDEVVVTGTLKLHNSSVYEFDYNNYIYTFSRKESAGLAYAETVVEKTVGDDAFINPLTNPNELTISYSTSNDQVAEVANDGTVTIVGEGSATITASFAGNPQYRAAQVSYIVTVSAVAPVLTDYYEKVTETAGIVEGTYLIVYEGESVAFDGGLDDSDNDHKLDKASNTIAVDITTDHKIGVTSATEAATFYIDPTAGTIQSASGKYIGVTSNSNGLKTSDNASAYNNSFAIDGDGNAIIGAVFSESTMTLRYNTDSGQKRFRYYKTTGSPAGQLYKLANEVTKLNPELAWDKESIELTVGGLFISPELSYAQGITGTISYVSDNETVATVENGVISLVAEATGTAHITASYAGDENFKSGSAVCTIKVNPAHSIYVDKLNVNFGSVAKDATVDDQVITVTLTEVPNATATLGGSGASAFSIDPAALTASGTITISASTATVGTFNAKLTISDNAGEAEAKEVNLKLIVTDPASEETPISTSTKWVAAVAADLVDGAEVLITGVKDEVTYAMGEQKSTNRAAYVATIDGEGVLTPGEGTMAFTLVAQEGGTFALRTSNGKYLYAAASGSNHLKTQDEVDVNAKWTLTIASAVAEGSSNRNIMRFNGSGTNKLFSCYSSGQEDIKFYVPKPVTPPTPVYETVRENLAANRYYTLCFNRTMEAVQGATFWTFASKDADMAYLVQEDAPYAAGKPYIIYAEAAGDLTAVLSGEEEPNAGSNGALHGTFSLMEQTALDNAGENIYLLMNNELRRVDGQSGNSLPAYRAYVALDEINNTGAPANVPAHRVRAIPMHKDVVTGFENINATDKPVKLLIDGNIYILRGEKMYDATGRLVK